MINVWQELKNFLKRNSMNRQTARKFELRKKLEQVLLLDRQM